jgi:predicted transposase YbfD/YdcC
MNIRPLLIMMFLLLTMTACQKQSSRKVLESGNAVYYWRTDLRLDSTERAFMAQYHINKVYCRYFDVVMEESGEPKPNATISFSDTLPDSIEIIPTVYITEECMHETHEGLAEKIVKRIRQMNETNEISNVREIQIDCDYTSKSRKRYYQFLEEVRKYWGATLSTTIRLHQLSMPVPPVDYGALMVYNTGDPRKSEERNPILDYRDVYPYLKHLDGYPLPLATAYPVFRWLRMVYGVRYEYTAEAEQVLRVKKAMEQERSDLSRLIITYHLDKDNIDRYKPDTYEEIYYH